MISHLARRALLIILAAAVLLASSSAPVSADRSGSTTNDEIARLYLGVFGRAPDLGGEVYWNHRANEGLTMDRMADFFVDSDEFRERFGNDNEAVLTALYQNVFDREPDAGGFAYWEQRINAGLEISAAVRHFTESPENLIIAANTPSRYDPQTIDGCNSPIDDYLQSYIVQMDKRLAIAVNDLDGDCPYSLGGNEPMSTASTFKLAVMGAVLLRAQDEGRSLSDTERSQLDGMIRFSDDPEVRIILGSMGGIDRMLRDYGSRLGISYWSLGQEPGRWGCVSWSPNSALSLMEHLTLEGVGELNADSQAIALGLLTNVTPSQRWGLGDGTLGVLDGQVAQKNGFANECSAGSRINSVGLVFDAAGAPAYSVAIYTDGWVDGSVASRQNDQPAYVVEARSHIDHIAEHIARMMSR